MMHVITVNIRPLFLLNDSELLEMNPLAFAIILVNSS